MKRQYLYSVIAILIVASGIVALRYQGGQLPEIPVPSDPRALSGLSITPVVLPDGTRVAAEIARTPAQLARGLMYRETVPPLTGMLMVYNTSEYRQIWMKNVWVDLDIVFIGENKQIVHIVKHLKKVPEDVSDEAIPRAMGYGRYVLELAAGEADRLGLRKGMQLSFL